MAADHRLLLRCQAILAVEHRLLRQASEFGGSSETQTMQLLLIAAILLSFLALPAVQAQAPGLPTEWEVTQNMTTLAAQVQRFKPILEEVDPKSWMEKGAPETYQKQWKSVGDKIEFLVHSTGELAKQPERLKLAIEALFRIQSLDSMLASMDEGIRKYQNPALADLLRATMTDLNVQQEKLRQYVLELAAVKEHELKIMDQEAQRCRGALSRHPQRESPEKKTEPK